MEKNKIKLYDGKVRGIAVSSYGLENGYLDYQTLSKIVGDCILNNTVVNQVHDWELMSGDDWDNDIYQYYIISEAGCEFLARFTDEIVYYNESLDIYLWCITHFGTSWDYVLTDVKLV